MERRAVGGADVRAAALDLVAFAPTGFLLSCQEAWRPQRQRHHAGAVAVLLRREQQDRLIAATVATLPVALMHPT
jgi:hypothetical protein